MPNRKFRSYRGDVCGFSETVEFLRHVGFARRIPMPPEWQGAGMSPRSKHRWVRAANRSPERRERLTSDFLRSRRLHCALLRRFKMSEVTLNVLDARRSIHGRVHGSTADSLVAALAADPATIEELQLAFGRFEARDPARPVLAGFRNGVDDEPWDAGIVYIDLTARMVVCDSTYSWSSHRGYRSWHDGSSARDHQIPYALADDWVIDRYAEWFHGMSRQRREQFVASPAIDERAVLYGLLPEFIVRQLFPRRDELLTADPDRLCDIVRAVHVDWMMTPRADLAGRSPREVLIDMRHAHITRDLQNQQSRWSMLRQAPPAIPRDSDAYRFGGFGTAEIVIYYELARELLHEAVTRFQDQRPEESQLPAEADRLRMFSQDWLHDPANPHSQPRTAAVVIDLERRRLPIKCHGDEAVIDPDCPCCQAMGNEEEFGPTFLCYDGSEMDDDFAFSFHRTRDEWEVQQRAFEELDNKWKERSELDPPPFDDENEDDVPF
jgi:hypothetical protein